MAFAPLLNHHAAFCCKAASPQQSRPAALPLLWRGSRHALLIQAATVLSPGAAGGAVLRSLGEQSSNAVPLGNTLSRSERSSGVEDVTTVCCCSGYRQLCVEVVIGGAAAACATLRYLSSLLAGRHSLSVYSTSSRPCGQGVHLGRADMVKGGGVCARRCTLQLISRTSCERTQTSWSC